MKLSEVQLREKVPTGYVGDTSARLHAKEGSAGAHGWSLDFEAGMVTAIKGDVVLAIPVGNIVWMRPEPKPAKPVKAA